MYFNVASRIFVFKSQDNFSWPCKRIWSKFSFMKFVNPWWRNIAFTLPRSSRLCHKHGRAAKSVPCPQRNRLSDTKDLKYR